MKIKSLLAAVSMVAITAASANAIVSPASHALTSPVATSNDVVEHLTAPFGANTTGGFTQSATAIEDFGANTAITLTAHGAVHQAETLTGAVIDYTGLNIATSVPVSSIDTLRHETALIHADGADFDWAVDKTPVAFRVLSRVVDLEYSSLELGIPCRDNMDEAPDVATLAVLGKLDDFDLTEAQTAVNLDAQAWHDGAAEDSFSLATSL